MSNLKLDVCHLASRFFTMNLSGFSKQCCDWSDCRRLYASLTWISY